MTAWVAGANVPEVLRTISSVSLLTVPLYVPVLALFVYGYHTYSLRLVLVFFVPDARRAAPPPPLPAGEGGDPQTSAAANERLRSANLSFATALVATLDARDQYTAGHSAAVAIYAQDIAAANGPVGGAAEARAPLRSRPRHRQDRAPGGPAREARAADPRGAAAHAAALRDRRADPAQRRRLLGDRANRPLTTTSGSTARAIPTGSTETRSLSSRGSSASPTRTTR